MGGVRLRITPSAADHPPAARALLDHVLVDGELPRADLPEQPSFVRALEHPAELRILPVVPAVAVHHSAPWPACACGIWALSSRLEALENAGEYAAKRLHIEEDSAVFAIGRVRLWGLIVECERGYRAQYAYPESVELIRAGGAQAGPRTPGVDLPALTFCTLTSRQIRQSLAHQYRVPVSLVDEDTLDSYRAQIRSTCELNPAGVRLRARTTRRLAVGSLTSPVAVGSLTSPVVSRTSVARSSELRLCALASSLFLATVLTAFRPGWGYLAAASCIGALLGLELGYWRRLRNSDG